MSNDSLKTITNYIDAIQAHIVKGKLNSEGIHASIAHEHHIWENWMISNAIGGVKIQVPESQVENAKKILADIDTGKFEIEDKSRLECPVCKSNNIVENKNSWRFAFIGLFALHIPIPYHRNKVKCNNCDYKWKLKF